MIHPLMRTAMLLAAIACAPQADAQRMNGFAEATAKGERIMLRVPAWMKGRLSADGALTGSVRRQSLGKSQTLGLFGVTVGGAERYGRFAFDVEGAAVEGALAGDCIYDRTERRVGVGALTVSQPLRPLLLRCRFIRAGEVVGGMELEAAPRTAELIQPSRRIGHAEIAGTRITIDSEHYFAGGRVSADQPLGYRFAHAGAAIGAVDLTGFTRRAIAAPTTGDARLVSLAAAIALSVFWDPGDTDD